MGCICAVVGLNLTDRTEFCGEFVRGAVQLGAVVAEVEVGEVETEGLHLPDQSIDAAVRGTPCTGFQKVLTNLGKTLDQVGGTDVVVGDVVGDVDEVKAVAFKRLEQPATVLRSAGRGNGVGEFRRECETFCVVVTPGDLRLATHHFGADFRRDERIAIPITSHPGGEAHEGVRRVDARVSLVQQSVKLGFKPGGRFEDRFVEEIVDVVRLVQRGHPCPANLFRVPERFENRARIIPFLFQTTYVIKHRAALGFGGMGGQHGFNLQLRENQFDLAGRDALFLQGAKKPTEGHGWFRGGLEMARAFALFAEIDQLEIEAEGMRDPVSGGFVDTVEEGALGRQAGLVTVMPTGSGETTDLFDVRMDKSPACSRMMASGCPMMCV